MLDIKDFKNDIENKNIKYNFAILKYSDTDFLGFQYVDAIAKVLNKPVKIIDDLSEMSKNTFSLFGDNDSDCIYLFLVDKFDYNNLDIISKDLYIICKTIDKKSLEVFNNYIVELPKLEDWQIKDYVYSVAEGANEKSLDRLIDVCGNDIYRINQELNKIKIFTKQERNFTFDKFIEDGIFSDLSTYSIFDFSNAIVKRDRETLRKIYKEIDKIDIEPIGLVTVLLNNFRNIIKIQLANNPTAESCGMKPNQFWAVKHSCGLYTKEQLLSIFNFLTEIDKKIKTGMIPVDSFLIDYIVVNILTRR